MFDFERYGDGSYGSVQGLVAPGDRLVGGKLEQSFLSFMKVHPNWRGGDEASKAFMERYHQFKDIKYGSFTEHNIA